MMIGERLLQRLALLLLAGITMVGCAQSSGTSGKKSKSGGSTGGGGVNAEGGELCESISQNQVASDPNFQDLVSSFCGGLLNTLRAPENQYRGNGTPNIQPTAVQKGSQSQMRLFAAMATPAAAKSYFNLMRLQTSRPDDFQSKNFEYDKAIKYEVLSNVGNSVSYHYINRKEDLVVEYNATSVFTEAIPDQLYIITSKLDQSLGIVKTFRGLQVIYQNSDQTGSFAEVFSMSDQLYDNNDDHNTTVTKAQNEFIQDMARGFRNSKRAQEADQFFP